jgi:Fe-S-cluster containining protein
MRSVSDLDCTRCGACCKGLSVELTAEDESRLSADEVLSLTRFDEPTLRRRLIQRPGGACIALREEEGRFLCSIYERRPGACRDFENGSRLCLQLREIREIRPVTP